MFREPFPILHVSDVERAVALYTGAFGFEVTFRWPGEGVVEFAFLKLGDTGIGIGRAEPPAVPDWPVERDVGTFQLCVYTDDTAAVAEHLSPLRPRAADRSAGDALGREARVLPGSGRHSDPRDIGG
jgi:catechol 2,3-dioxygenase-like lactoylglutathione lyase family enzyme